MQKENIYEPAFVEALFDNMSSTYSRMNYITSFGFSDRWRRQCVQQLNIERGKVTVDLLTGMGECWKFILNNHDSNSTLIGLDFSTEMVSRATKQRARYIHSRIEVLKENVFENSLDDASADYVVSGFGLKTFHDDQLTRLAGEINRILKPNGSFSLIDVSVPKNKILRSLYMLYLKRIIPVLGKLFLGNPETYKMLGVYTEKFIDAKKAYDIFKTAGFEIEYVEYFFGCASGIKGRKINY